MADSNPLFNQADALWKILDDLAETNPEGYTKFMEKFLREHEDWVKPPEPVFCFRTLKVKCSTSSSRTAIVDGLKQENA